MSEQDKNLNEGERAVLVFAFQDRSVSEEKRRIVELREIVTSSGGTVAAIVTQRLARLVPRTLIGAGKVEEIADYCAQEDIDLVVFDTELTGAQRHHLSEAIPTKVLDRVDLILDIFALRARTTKAKIDVMLAQLAYRLPHLRGLGTALSRTGGGIGTRGPGEQQLETDRRAIERQMKKLRAERESIRLQEIESSKRRQTGALPIVSLVGYTNAGKSTIMNALVSRFGDAEKTVYADDRLFATLEVSLRRIDKPGEPPYLLADTVGFIHDLPEKLHRPFASTLEEIKAAALILHVVDQSAEGVHARVKTVMDETADLRRGALLYVLNKRDLSAEPLVTPPAESIAISAKDEGDIDRLQDRILTMLYGPIVERKIFLSYAELKMRDLLMRHGSVLEEEALEKGLNLVVRAREDFFNRWMK